MAKKQKLKSSSTYDLQADPATPTHEKKEEEAFTREDVFRELGLFQESNKNVQDPFD